MKFILAEKKEMTQKFSENGNVVAVTRVIAGPCVVTQLKSDKLDGYTAVQLGFGAKKKIGKALKGHLKDLGNFAFLKEFRIQPDQNNLAVGNVISAKIFAPGDIIKVAGTSKGRGFQGVVKRHGFSGSPATHGHKDQLRMPGSIGAGGPQHVFKGTRMAGHMGDASVTVKNLEVIEVNQKTNEIFIKGGLPGATNGLLLISGVGDFIIEAEAKEEPKVEPVLAATEEKAEEIKEEPKVESQEVQTKPEEKTNA